MSSISEHEFHPLPPAPQTEHNLEVLVNQDTIYKTKEIIRKKDYFYLLVVIKFFEYNHADF